MAKRKPVYKKKISNGKRMMRQSWTMKRAQRKLRIQVKRMGI